MNGKVKKIENRAAQGLPKKPSDYIVFLVVKPDNDLTRYGVILMQNLDKKKDTFSEWTVTMKETNQDKVLGKAISEMLRRTKEGSSIQIITDTKALLSILCGRRKIKGGLKEWKEADELLKGKAVNVHVQEESKKNIFSAHIVEVLEREKGT